MRFDLVVHRASVVDTVGLGAFGAGGHRDPLVDVAVAEGRIVAVAVAAAGGIGSAGGELRGETEIDADGGALIPGLHDHHLHLLALESAMRSVRAGPPEVRSATDLERVLRRADAELAPGRWLRGVGYHESVAGELDRTVIDRLVPGRPVRIQHRTGAMWVLNTKALVSIGLRPDDSPTGQLFDADDVIGTRVPRELPDLTAVGARLAGLGVTGVTDATPFRDGSYLAPIVSAIAAGSLPQRVTAMGAPGVDPGAFAGVGRGPAKIVVGDHVLPTVDELVGRFRRARREKRTVAVHCVTRVGLVLALAAWDDVGVVDGDRIEHASVVDVGLANAIAERGLVVVTQPNFVAERGDEYLRDVDPLDLADLYPCRRLLEAGVPLGSSTDAPFGDPDPWRAIRAAARRETAGGSVLGAAQCIDPSVALRGFLTAPERPGGAPRRVAVGWPADLCLLSVPLGVALAEPAARHVRLTMCEGRIAFSR